MTKTENLMADLAEASRIAKSGEDTPLVGGPIGLWWGVMLTGTLAIHYMIIEQILALPMQSLSFLWIGYAVIGGIVSGFLGKKIEKKPGATSIANRVESYVWIMFVGLMASLAIGVILNMVLGGGGYELWTLVLIVGFAGQGLAYGVTAKLTGHSWLHFASFASFTMAAFTMSFYSSNIVYLLGAIGTVVTVIIPSLLSMKAAR